MFYGYLILRVKIKFHAVMSSEPRHGEQTRLGENDNSRKREKPKPGIRAHTHPRIMTSLMGSNVKCKVGKEYTGSILRLVA